MIIPARDSFFSFHCILFPSAEAGRQERASGLCRCLGEGRARETLGSRSDRPHMRPSAAKKRGTKPTVLSRVFLSTGREVGRRVHVQQLALRAGLHQNEAVRENRGGFVRRGPAQFWRKR